MRVALALALLAGASAVTTPSHDESADMLNNNEFDIIIDVRSESEYEEGHIEGAVLWSRTNLDGCTDQRIGVLLDRLRPLDACRAAHRERWPLERLRSGRAAISRPRGRACDERWGRRRRGSEPVPRRQLDDRAHSAAEGGDDKKSLCTLTKAMMLLAFVGVVGVAGVALAYVCSRKTKVTDTTDNKSKAAGDQVVELERLGSDEQAKAVAAPAAEVITVVPPSVDAAEV